MKRRSLLFPLLILALPVLGFTGILLHQIPPAGTWCNFKVLTREKGLPRQQTLRVAVVEDRSNNGFYLEYGQTKFFLDKSGEGTLGLALPRSLDTKGRLLPFVAARSILFAVENKGPVTPSSFVMNRLRGAAKKAKVSENWIPQGSTVIRWNQKEMVVEKVQYKATTHLDYLGQKEDINIEGTLWVREDFPFMLVRAEVTETQTKKGKTKVKERRITCKDFSYHGAKAAISGHPRTVGLFRLINQ